MPARPRQRTITYYRPVWSNNRRFDISLESSLRTSLDYFEDDLEQTRSKLGLGDAEIRHHKRVGNALYLHIASWVPRQPASTVPHGVPHGMLAGDLGSNPAGNNWDYLHGDGMLLISRNDVLIMPSARLNFASIQSYVRSLITSPPGRGDDLPKSYESFRLLPIVNAGVARRLHGNIARIDFNLGAYRETIASIERSDSLTKQLFDSALQELFPSQAQRVKAMDAENMTLQLILKLDSRRRGLEPSDLSSIVDRVEDEPEDENNYTFVTRDGERIRNGEIILSRRVKLQPFADTVHYNEAWEKMWEFFIDLDEMGALER